MCFWSSKQSHILLFLCIVGSKELQECVHFFEEWKRNGTFSVIKERHRDENANFKSNDFFQFSFNQKYFKWGFCQRLLIKSASHFGNQSSSFFLHLLSAGSFLSDERKLSAAHFMTSVLMFYKMLKWAFCQRPLIKSASILATHQAHLLYFCVDTNVGHHKNNYGSCTICNPFGK